METFEPIRTEILTDPTLTDAEMRLIAYLVTKPPGWKVRDKDIMRSLDRAQNWVAKTKAKLRRRGLLTTQPRSGNGRFLVTDCYFNRDAVVHIANRLGENPLTVKPVHGKTSAIEKLT